jgi:hypothetical protein
MEIRAGTGPSDPAPGQALGIACLRKWAALIQVTALAEGGQDFVWRKNSDAAESAKILGIERQ